MTKKELLKGYMAYIRKIPSIAGSVSNYRPIITKLPFDYIKIVMSEWEVKENNGKYEEQIIGYPSTKNTCDKRTYNLWRYYKKNIEPVATYDYLQLISDFIDHNDIVYALSIIDIISGIAELANRYKKEYNSQMRKINPNLQINFSNTTKADYFSKCRKALKFMLEWAELNKSFIQNVRPNPRLDSIRKRIVKPLIYKIDGAKALAKEIGVDKFIQYAIDQCYFFEPEIVKNRMNVIVTTFTKTHKKGTLAGMHFDLYARRSNKTTFSTTEYSQVIDPNYSLRQAKEKAERGGIPSTRTKNDYRLFTDPDPLYSITDYPVIIDTDGNEDLRSIINVNYTGYTISSGKGGIFQNYRISHVWGRAFDPRFFTNLWNVVLIPAWANDLLDKPNPLEGSLESKLKSTIQRICEVLYFGMITNWSALGLAPQIINNRNDIITYKGNSNNKNKINNLLSELPENHIIYGNGYVAGPLPYLINVIEDKGVKTVGDIVKYAVYI